MGTHSHSLLEAIRASTAQASPFSTLPAARSPLLGPGRLPCSLWPRFSLTLSPLSLSIPNASLFPNEKKLRWALGLEKLLHKLPDVTQPPPRGNAQDLLPPGAATLTGTWRNITGEAGSLPANLEWGGVRGAAFWP